MDHLVTMTTHVPEGTSEAAIQDMRDREAARARELADSGHLLRLWRPPLQPGEWRSLGLFAAADDADLESVLASMPLRAWRTDDVSPLLPHPNDPADATRESARPSSVAGVSEFLTTLTVTVPSGTPDEVVDAAEAREAVRARQLAGQGHLSRLWKLPGDGQSLGLWRARDAGELAQIFASLPLGPWLSVQTTPLAPHPSDPARANGG